MEERSGVVADYFVVAGLPENPELVDEDVCEGLNPIIQNFEPITDITVIFPTLGERVPLGFHCVEKTPTGFPADLNSGSLRTPEVYLCYRRGRDKPPLVDIGVMYDGKERLLPDAEVVISTPEGRPANVNNTSARTLLTYRRAAENMPCNELVVTDVCVIMQNKGERPPHAFCLINKNLNKSLMGCDVFLCYKKSMNRPPFLSYKAEVLHRYPPIDRRGFPLPSLAAMFCLPMCATVECWPKIATQPRPVFSTFILTVADATEKIYGAATTFYEKYPEEKLTDEQREKLGVALPGDRSEKSVHVNKCICLLSHHPFFDSFRAFLLYLHMMSRTGPHDVPIERYISHILEEVPFPSPQRPHILMQLSPMQSVLLSHPHDSPLTKSGASFRQLLSSLGPDNCLMVLLLVLTEQKLLIHSLRPDVLTAVAEAVSVIIFPFHWQCPYIPLCPLGLCAVLQAPVPFLVGVDSRFFDFYEPPSDVTCIDLDTNTITVSDDKKFILNYKLVPKKPGRALRGTLEMLQERAHSLGRTQAKIRGDASDVLDIDFQLRKRERSLELEIQEAFLRFMTSILKGYRSFLLPITKAPTIGATDASSLFDFQGFQRSRDKAHQKFYQMMLRTQMFFRFIEERSFVSDIDTGLAFFDECIDKIEQDDSESVRLLDISESNQSERTVFVMPPEPIGLPADATYSYNSVFSLEDNRFGGAKPKSSSLDRVMQRSDQSIPGSPVARRTKQEIKSAQKNARKYSEKPKTWAKYLLSTCYSLWFIHLPSYLTVASSKHMALCMAYDILVRMEKSQLQPFDEVCYRVVMQLCGLYSQPVVAVKVLFEMKRCGLTPNAITYGFYNKAVLEAQWPSNVSNSSQLMWNKLRNVIYGVSQFRAAGRQYSLRSRRLSHSLDEVDRLSTGSGGSMESQTHQQSKSTTQMLPTASTLSPQGVQNNVPVIGKSNSDSETNNTSMNAIPTRISSSSDIGYGSMNDHKVSSEIEDVEENDDLMEKTVKTGRFWGKMGQSLDQWVKSGVTSLANVASMASDTSYYSPAGLIMSSYKGDYSGKDYDDEDGDEFDVKEAPVVTGKSHRKLAFDDDSESQVSDGTKNDTLRLLRSVSFGNDTQIMCKLKELKEDMVAENTKVNRKSEVNEEKRSGSEESSVSLEGKVNQYYEDPSRETSVGKSLSNSREVTPVDNEEENQLTIRPGSLHPVTSSAIQIKEDLRESTPCSPARTPVTQNDPLGALNDEESLLTASQALAPVSTGLSTILPQNRDSPKRTCSEGQIGQIGNGNGVLMGPPGSTVKHFHRSSTLPNYTTALGTNGSGNSTPTDDKMAACAGLGSSNNVVTSLSAISSSLKNPFGRYSPGRLSLRKAGTSLIESTIGGKKAEALMEGFNQFKSVAAVTMKNKIEELKEVVGNNSPAGRNGPFGRLPDDGRGSGEDLTDLDNGEQTGDQWASVSESYLDQLLLTADTGSTRASFASADIGLGPSHHDTPLSSSTQSLLMVDNVKTLTGPPNRKDHPNPVALEISMTTCSICHNCGSLLFDEEIMAGWTAEDSNLNTKCPHCNKLEVPFLEVTVKDFRYTSLTLSSLLQSNLTTAPSLESMNSAPNSSSRRTSLFTPTNSGTNAVNYTTQQQSVTKLSGAINSQPTSTNIQNGNSETVNENDVQSKSTSGDILDGNTCSGIKKVEKHINGTDRCEEAIINGTSEVLPPLDPLGVLEEKSRRNSPEPAETNNPTSGEPASVTNPTVSLTAPCESVSSKAQATKHFIEIDGIEAEPIIVPYLSPLVLRKELENVLDHEGDSCLIQARFVDEHPIIYWNLVWFFHRANLTSHIKGLSLQAKSLISVKPVPKRKSDDMDKIVDSINAENSNTNTPVESETEPFSIHPSWEGADHRNVVIKCKWDNPKFHEQFGTPLYVQWLQMSNKSDRDSKTEEEKNSDNNNAKLITNVLRAVQGNTLAQTCPQLLYHYHKQSRPRHYPTYRDILFLSLTAAGRESCEFYGSGFDRDYRDVYSKLRNNDDFECMDLGDRPPLDDALFCRKFFKDLQL